MRTISLLATAAVATTVLTTVTADAGVIIGAGVQMLSTQYKGTDTSSGESHKKSGSQFGGDLMVGYTFLVAPSVTLTPLADIQTPGKKVSMTSEGLPGTLQRQIAYGAKVRVGYNVSPKVALFADAGMRFSTIKTIDAIATVNRSMSGPVVGAGVGYNVTNDVSVLGSYERVIFGKHTNSDGTVQATENNFRVGVTYAFAI